MCAESAPTARLFGPTGQPASRVRLVHCRTGNPATIAGYLGAGAVFDDALADFAVAYADQTERDHAAFMAAIQARRIEAQAGI